MQVLQFIFAIQARIKIKKISRSKQRKREKGKKKTFLIAGFSDLPHNLPPHLSGLSTGRELCRLAPPTSITLLFYGEKVFVRFDAEQNIIQSRITLTYKSKYI